MKIDVVTLFPEIFDVPLRTSLLGRAIETDLLDVGVTNLRDFGLGTHRSVDDEPYGGGAGMVMRPEPVFSAVESVKKEGSHVVLLSPRGALFDHAKAKGFASAEHLVLICGRYEGIDERVALHLADEEISIGDFVLSGGEVAALCVIEAVSRFIPGVLGNEASLASESHAAGLLEYPQYTRPAEFRGWSVPGVLTSGDHGAVDEWRRDRSEQITRERRPDLLS
ncbi:MAG TPA: tRNA (guanosine(37)-N1)-methyltransferase TrmD [Actinomycetota bacterium]|nr:tRNA (guanosine(37)-N1)-methyltransferase TrmD [Actinomycetota bacterium]